jgi:hypothetical protein
MYLQKDIKIVLGRFYFRLGFFNSKQLQYRIKYSWEIGIIS